MLGVVATQPLMACDLCSVYAVPGPRGPGATGFFAGVAEQFTYFNTLQVNGQQVPNAGNQYLNSSVSQAFAGYNFSDRIGVQFNLPVIYRDYGYQAQRGTAWGLGDVSLVGNLRLYQKATDSFNLDWTALGGVKFPTGNSSLLNPDQEEFAPGIGGHDLTLGSGSYDGIVGTGFVVGWNRLFLTGTMQYAIRTQGDFGYQFANDWTWAGGPGYYLLRRDRATLALHAIVSGESKANDRIHGIATDDTAITAVYLGPQIEFTWRSSLSLEIGGDLPVSIVTSGEQIVPDFRVRAAVTWRF